MSDNKFMFSDWKIDTPIEQIIINAIGAGSVCWEHPEKAGIFDSTRALQIADEVIANIKKKLFYPADDKKPQLGYATTRELLEELKARAEVSVTVGEYEGPMRNIVIITGNLLEGLPMKILDYKTVGED